MRLASTPLAGGQYDGVVVAAEADSPSEWMDVVPWVLPSLFLLAVSAVLPYNV